MTNSFKDKEIQKVVCSTLRLETIFECGGWAHSKVGAGMLCNREEGLILTNAHIVSDYFTLGTLVKDWVLGKVVANFEGGEQCDAEVLSVDVGNDLALLKISKMVIKPHNIPCVFSKDVPRRGAEFFVVGHPIGVPFNVKFGRVSDPSRSPSDIPRYILDGFPHSLEHMDQAMEFLELDVDAVPGFSGGPLSTVDGLVFGVLHAEIRGTARYGIPVDIIESVFDRMVKRSLEGKNVFCHLN